MRMQTGREIVLRMRHVVSWFDQVCAWIAPPMAPGLGSPDALARMPILIGAWMVVMVFGVFGLWTALAPLDSAAIAPGFVVLDSNKKTIQHLEGGVIEEILIHEGDKVQTGQPLIRLNETASKARLDLYKGQLVAARAANARLLAERDGKEEVVFAQDLLDSATDDNLKDIIESQRQLFKSRRDTLKGQIDILGQKINQSKQEINGLQAQIKSANDQIRLLGEEISVVKMLLEKGNAVKPRLLALERAQAQLQGQRGENSALIARAEQTITEAEFSITTQKNDFITKVNQELRDTQTQISDLNERLKASADVMNRVVIVSPISGIITDLKVHTKGGVITPGEKIMDIVPLNDKLIVESQVTPQDIDVVRAGLYARVRLTAYKARRVPPIDARVVNVSADRFVEQRTGNSYYIARVEVDEHELSKLKEVELYPGMPAEVLIITGERTLLNYILSPISDYFNRAFREQ